MPSAAAISIRYRSQTDLTYPQYLMMVVLWEEEGLGMKDLAARLGQDNGSITPLVKRLEAEGYFIRNRNPHYERNRIITLTRAGKDLRAQGLKVSEQIQRLCGIGSDVAVQLMASLDQVNQNLSAAQDATSSERDAVGQPGSPTLRSTVPREAYADLFDRLWSARRITLARRLVANNQADRLGRSDDLGIRGVAHQFKTQLVLACRRLKPSLGMAVAEIEHFSRLTETLHRQAKVRCLGQPGQSVRYVEAAGMKLQAEGNCNLVAIPRTQQFNASRTLDCFARLV